MQAPDSTTGHAGALIDSARASSAAEPGEWTNAGFRDVGLSSTVCTPLTWSLYERAFGTGLKSFLADLKLLRNDFVTGRMFFGRPYWNLGEVKRCLARLPGFVERELDADLGVETRYDGDGTRTPVTLLGVLRALPTTLAIPKVFRDLEREATKLLDGEFDRIEARIETVPDNVDREFPLLIETDFDHVQRTYFRAIFCSSLAERDLRSSFPRVDYAALGSALPPTQRLTSVIALREMAASGDTDVTPLLRRFRHHSRKQLDLRAPRWGEDREFVEQLVESYRGSSAGDLDTRADYERARADALAALPRRKRKKFERELDQLRRLLWLREELRDISDKIYYHVRRYVLAIAEQRGLGDDVFFMTFDQIVDDDRSEIERNRETHDAYLSVDAPNEVGQRGS